MSFNNFTEGTVFSYNSSFRAEKTPFWAAVPIEQAVNLTVPGTPPYMVHSSLYDSVLRTQLSYWQHLPGNLSTNSFVWTPELLKGPRAGPVTEGNETDFRPQYGSGDSIIWVFTEMQGDFRAPGVESDVYVSGNFTILTKEEYEKLDTTYRENGGVLRTASLKGLAITALLGIALLL